MTNNTATATRTFDEREVFLGEARTAAFVARNRDLAHRTPVALLNADAAKHGFEAPVSGDHLCTYAIRDEYEDEVARKRLPR